MYMYTHCICTRNTHSQRASRQYYHAHAHKCIAQLCARILCQLTTFLIVKDMYIRIYMYVHHEKRSLSHSLTLVRSAIKPGSQLQIRYVHVYTCTSTSRYMYTDAVHTCVVLLFSTRCLTDLLKVFVRL